MGYYKVIAVSKHKVKLVHQLNTDGTAYAEDITVETMENVDEGRLDYLGKYDGTVGYANLTFSRAPEVMSTDSIRFPTN